MSLTDNLNKITLLKAEIKQEYSELEKHLFIEELSDDGHVKLDIFDDALILYIGTKDDEINLTLEQILQLKDILNARF